MAKYDKAIKLLKEDYYRVFGRLAHDMTSRSMEISVNELRIGNLVTDNYYDSFKTVMKVESITMEGINVFASDDNKPYGLHSAILDYEYLLEDIKPIPLKEEWLVKFGFENYRNTGNYKIKSNEYWSLGELKQGYLKIKLTKANNFRVENFGNKSLTLNTVHRLQNFYFALTGQELTIK